MASSTNPPSNDLVSNLVLSDTFYTWFNVSNDIINKLNPIEVYSISADARDYTTVGADGVTIDDLGNGNYRIGYIMPSNITGGHTFHQDINFANGVSGEIVNTLNGVTGEAVAVTQVSGKPITTTVAGVANIEAVVLEINGISAATAGGLTLDLEGLGVTGEQGSILSVSGGGAYSHNVKFFTPVGSANPLFDQTALRLKGLTQGARAVVGSEIFGANYRLKVDGTEAAGASGAIEVHGNDDNGAGILLIDDGSICGETKLTLMSGKDGGTGIIELKTGNSHLPGSQNTKLSVGTDYVKIHDKLKDGSGAAGSVGSVLTSTGSGVSWAPATAPAIGTTITDAKQDTSVFGQLFTMPPRDGFLEYTYGGANPIMCIFRKNPSTKGRTLIYYRPVSNVGGYTFIGRCVKSGGDGHGYDQNLTWPMVSGSQIKVLDGATDNGGGSFRIPNNDVSFTVFGC